MPKKYLDYTGLQKFKENISEVATPSKDGFMSSEDKVKLNNEVASHNEVIVDNLLPYPYYDGSSKTVNGITTTIDENGWAHIKGTASAATNCFDFTSRDVEFPPDTYTISGVPEGASSSGYRAWLGIYKSGTTTQLQSYQVYADGVTFTANEPFTMIFRATASAGAVVDVVYKPMLEVGSVAHPYQPYNLSRKGIVEQIVVDNLLPYPYNETSHTEDGIIWTDNGDGTVTANGTATGSETSIFYFSKAYTLPKGQYIMSGCPKGGSDSTYNLRFIEQEGSNVLFSAIDEGNGIEFELTEEKTVFVFARIKGGATVSNLTFKPMIEVGTVAHPYQPYNLSRQKLREDIDNGNITIKTPLKITDDAGVTKNIIETINPTPDSPTEYGSEVLIGGDGNVFIGAGESHRNLRNTLANTENLLTGETYVAAGENMYIGADSHVLIYSRVNSASERKAIAFDSSGCLHPLIDGQEINLGSANYPWYTTISNRFYLYSNGVTNGYFGTYTQGTTSTQGNARLVLGNNKASGVDNNSKGSIYLFGENTGYTIINPTNNTTSNVTINLPSKSGTLYTHTTLTTATDFDTLKTTGIYHIKASSNTNAPTANHGTLLVDFDIGTPYQIFTPDNVSNCDYKRNFKNNAWTEWVQRKFTDTTTAIKVQSTFQKPTTEDWYYMLFAKTSATDTNVDVSHASGIRYFYNDATADVTGRSGISLGATTTDSKKGVRGCLRLYDTNGYYINFYSGNNTLSKNIAIYLPNTEGTLALNTVATTSANGLMSSTDKAKLDNTNVAYGTCSTAAATAAKVIAISGNTNWVLKAGSMITVKFSATNTAQNPTFNVNSTGAKSVWYNTGLITTSNLGYAGYANRPMNFVYDGTQYVFVGWSVDSNSDTKNTTGTTDKADTKLFLAGATSQASNPTTYSNSKVYIGTDNCLYSNGAKVSIEDHTHNYAGSSSAGGAATSANKVNKNLVVKLNSGTTEGTDLFTFNGSTAKTINITPSSIGASASSHTHDVVTTSTDGIMSKEDKAKIDGIGTVSTATPSAVSLSSQSGSSGTAVANLKLSKGTYMVTCAVHFPPYSSSAGSYRRASLNTTSGKIEATLGTSMIAAPINNQTTMVHIGTIIEVTDETTYYLNAQHNSSESLSVSGQIKAIKVG